MWENVFRRIHVFSVMLVAGSEELRRTAGDPFWTRIRRPMTSRRLHSNLAAAADRGPADFAELLLVPGVGARTVRALAMVAEVVHRAPYRFSDRARFSQAHGGKDRHPFPVPLRVYDETIRVLKSAVHKAKLGREEEIDAIKRLDLQARLLERYATGPSVEAIIEQEMHASPNLAAGAFLGLKPASQL
jgi:uncharacterized protein